jgi:hypothetical protein
VFGLSFLSPWFLLGALGVALPILLHLRRKDTAPQHAFSAVRFLRRAPFEQRRPKKLRDLLLLALRAAALLLIALAFARPYFADGQTAGPTTVVAVDTSFSMGAPEVFGRARQAAGRAVSKAPAGSRIAVVRFDDYAVVLAPPSLDRGSARAAIGNLASGAGGTEYGAMLAVATRLLGATGGRLVVVTDLQRAAWTGAAAGALPEGVDLEVVDVGAPLENLAVTSVRREGDAVVAQITNHGFAARSSRVELSLNDRSIAEARAEVEPGRTAAVSLVGRLPSNGLLRVSVEDAAGFPADNERFLVLDPPPAPAALILADAVTGGDVFYLRTAIESADPGRHFALEVLGGDQRNALTTATARERHVIVLSGTRGIGRPTRSALAEYLRDGGGVLLIAGPTLDAGTLSEIVGAQGGLQVGSGESATFPTALAPNDTRHPVLAAFGDAASSLGQAQFTRAVRITPGQGGRVITRFANGLPALVEQPVGRGRLLVLATDLGGEWNTFPRHSAFVPFVLETLRYLTGLKSQPTDVTVAEVPPGALPRSGAARIGTPPQLVAVNVDVRESAVARITATQLASAVRRVEPEGRAADAAARERETAQGIWRLVLMAVAALLVAEGVLGHRRSRPSSSTAAGEVAARPETALS